MSLLDQITSSVKSGVEERRQDFEYRRALNTKFASAVLRSCIPFPQKSWDNTIIAEVKMNSPTKGRLARESETHDDVAAQYLKGGAQTISVLTEAIYFEGDLSHLASIRTMTSSTPLMRKDFVVDKMQIQEARAFGADGVLLIACLLEDSLTEFLDYAKSVGMWTLVETRRAEEIAYALESGADIIGVNSRDLHSGSVDLDRQEALCTLIPDDKKYVVESGVSYPEDIRYLRENCPRKPDAYLIGTALMTASDRPAKVKSLREA